MSSKNNFLNYINKSTSPYYVVKNSSEILDEAGFQYLNFEESWVLERGSSYYVKLYDTTMYAFHIGKDVSEDTMLRIAAAHTDFPSFRIKPNPEMREKGYIKLNTETYGGMILSTWFDRPLSISGKIALKSEQLFQPKELLVDFKKPLLVIPNLAIHLNREVNKGVEINKQKDVLPLLGMTEDKLDIGIMSLIAEELKVDKEDILDYDLFIYNPAPAQAVGINQEFIVAPRLDDLSSAYGLLQGIIDNPSSQDIHMVCLFDNEEIGNKTKQGGASLFTNMLLEKIFNSLGMTRIKLYEVLQRSTILSVDVAQGYHPNYTGFYDPTNIAELNKGIAIKIDSSQRYAYDTGAIAIIQQLCEEYKIPYQKFLNRSDSLVGSTMGPVLSSQLPVRTIDVGVPLLAMHSSMETMGRKDLDSLLQLMKVYFSAIR